MTLFECIEETERSTGPAQIVTENHNWTDGCHNLATRGGRISMFSARQTPWHKLGTVIDRAANSQEALRFAHLAGWGLEKVQAYVDFQDRRLPLQSWAIARTDTGDILAHHVGDRYTIVSNEKCFAIMDDIVQEGGARYETAGALGKGETAWMLAQMPGRVEVAPGDEVMPYLLCTTSHDGSASIRIFPTTVRVVCQNTHRAACSAGRGKGISLRHTSNVGQRVKDARAALGFAQKELTTFTDQAVALAHTQVEPQEYFAAVLDDILDVTVAGQAVTQAAINGGSVLDAILSLQGREAKVTAKAHYDRAIERRRELLADIVTRYDSSRNNGQSAIAGTGWAAFNAVSEHIDHSPLWRANKQAESRFERVLLGAGDDAKQAAWKLATEAIAG